ASTTCAALFSSGFIFLTVSWLKAYSLLISPYVGLAGRWLVLLRKAPPTHYRLAVDWERSKTLLRSGFVLSLLTFLMCGYNTVDRTAVAAWLPIADLGYYTFVLTCVNTGILLIS